MWQYNCISQYDYIFQNSNCISQNMPPYWTIWLFCMSHNYRIISHNSNFIPLKTTLTIWPYTFSQLQVYSSQYYFISQFLLYTSQYLTIFITILTSHVTILPYISTATSCDNMTLCHSSNSSVYLTIWIYKIYNLYCEI